MMRILTYWLFIILLLLNSCKTTNQSISSRNVSNIYNTAANGIHPEALIYHRNDSISTLYVRVDPSEVNFDSKVVPDDFKGKMKIHYELYNSFSDKVLIDSSSVIYNIENSVSEPFVVTCDVKAMQGKDYILELTVSDEIRKHSGLLYLEVRKKNLASSQNYLLVSKQTGNVFFANWFNPGTRILIKSERVKPKKYFVTYYRKINMYPPPPFSTSLMKPISLKPDSVWEITATDSSYLKIIKEGIFFVQSDTAISEGISVFNFGQDYPLVNNSDRLLMPIRYLTSQKEFKEIEIYADRKSAVDNYWLKAAGNIERAKEIIKAYYRRVVFANLFFSSHKEGWLTDRGMIYVVFGPPAIVYKNDRTEQWNYSQRNEYGMISFTFAKVNNRFTDNDYELIRSELYKGTWYQAVDTWRNGRVFAILK